MTRLSLDFLSSDDPPLAVVIRKQTAERMREGHPQQEDGDGEDGNGIVEHGAERNADRTETRTQLVPVNDANVAAGESG